MQTFCPLCNTANELWKTIGTKQFYRCTTCDMIYVHPTQRLTAHEEALHYSKHRNIATDPNYQAFAKPIIDFVLQNFNSHHSGLDYGSGADSAIIYILENHNYTIKSYDPNFYNNPELLARRYNYITCCEVIEHFRSPREEFAKLYTMLTDNAALVCMTQLYDNSINFRSWYYKNDPTHVCFYTANTCNWITTTYNFTNCHIHKRRIVFARGTTIYNNY